MKTVATVVMWVILITVARGQTNEIGLPLMLQDYRVSPEEAASIEREAQYQAMKEWRRQVAIQAAKERYLNRLYYDYSQHPWAMSQNSMAAYQAAVQQYALGAFLYGYRPGYGYGGYGGYGGYRSSYGGYGGYNPYHNYYRPVVPHYNVPHYNYHRHR